MKVIIATVSGLLALGIGTATAKEGGSKEQRSDWFAAHEQDYLSTYEQCWKALGAQCGRNLVDDGLASGGEPSEAQVEESTARMQAWLNPPEPVPEEVPAEPVAEAAPAPSYSGGVSNSTVMCESGGDYGANTGNGYYGGYQFDSGTWDAYGDSAYGEANEAPPAVQDAAAASVPYDAWPNC